MTETSKQLSQQTKEILGETVVLGKGFEDTNADSKAYALSKRTGNQDDESFFDRVKDFFSPKPKEEEPLEVIQVPELKVTPAIPVKEDEQIDAPTGNPLYQYHLNNLKEENIIDGNLTTVFITGITNPEDGKIYNVPGFVDGKIINNENQLQRIAKERNWFGTYTGYSTGDEANQAARELKKQIDKDGQKFLSSLNNTITPKNKPDEIKFMYDADLIAKMIVTEAGDKDLNEEEMLAMASVVVNRANKKTGFSIGKGETRIEKLIRSGDFLGVTEFKDRFNNPRKTHEEKYVKALNIARDLLTGKVKDNTGGALYFNQDSKSGGKKYGEHYFYVDPYESR